MNAAQDITLDGKRGWSVVAAGALGLAFGPSAIIMLSFGVLASVVQKEFGWTHGQATFGAALSALMIMLMAPLQGWLIDRHGARRVILCSLPFWGALLLTLLALPPSLPLFYAFCLLVPVAALGLLPLSFLSLPNGWFDRHLGLAVGFVNLGIGIGAFLVPLVLGYGIAHFGWRWSYAGLGLIVLLIVWPVSLALVRNGAVRPGQTAKASAAAGGLQIAAMVKSPVFINLSASMFVLGVTTSALLVHLVPILIDRGVSQSDAIALQSALGLGTIIGRVVAGWLLDHFAARTIGNWVFALAVAAQVALAILPDPAFAFIPAILCGLVVGAEFDVLVVVIRRYFGVDAFGRLYGIAFAVFQLGGAIGTAGLGAARTQMGDYRPSLWVLTALLVVGGILFTRIGRPPEGAPAQGLEAAKI